MFEIEDVWDRSMFDIEDLADTEFDELLEHVDLGKLDVVDSRSRGWYAKYVLDGTPVMKDVGTCVRGLTRAMGSSPALSHMWRLRAGDQT